MEKINVTNVKISFSDKKDVKKTLPLCTWKQMKTLNAAIVLKWLKGNVLNDIIAFQNIQPNTRCSFMLDRNTRNRRSC